MFTSFVVFVGTNYDVRTHGLGTFAKGWVYNLKGYVLPTVDLNPELYGTDPEGKPFKGHSGFAQLNECVLSGYISFCQPPWHRTQACSSL